MLQWFVFFISSVRRIDLEIDNIIFITEKNSMKFDIFEKTLTRFFLIMFIGVVVTGCGAPAWKKPMLINEVEFMAYAKTITHDDISVTVSIPSREQTTLLFGTSLYADQIQPVWIEIDNRSDNNYILLKAGVDKMLYSPLEASYQRHSGPRETKLEMDQFFSSMDFENPVIAGEVNSGFVFTPMDEGVKAVNIDLVGDKKLDSYSFVIKVPDSLTTDASLVDFDSLYDNWIEIADEQELRDVLASFPCCTANEDGNQWGDPLNVVMVGKRSNIFSALIRSGWHQTEVSYGASLMKTIKSFLFGSRYRYSPISPLYVFDRQQDIGLQKARSSISLRNHMRMWRTQYNYKGKDVYLGQISRDIGVKFNKRTFTTHVIDPDVDDTRGALMSDLAYSQSLVKVGLVKGSQPSTMEDTYYNLTPDPYYSDGYRAVMFFDERPTTLDQIELLDWEKGRIHTVKE
jgi:hypothetical protein